MSLKAKLPELGEVLVNLTDVHKAYRLGTVNVHALRGLTLSVNRGEFTALVGPSGAGKSTLMNLIGCIDRASDGVVAIAGTDVSKLSEGERCELRNELIGFVFQSYNLIPVLNVFENVELPLLARSGMSRSERRELVLELIRDVGLEKHLQHRPDNLSGGQRQRVAVARALVTSPSIVIADEPTANLDSKAAHHIVDLMVQMNESRHVTFIFSTHDEKIVGRVRRTVRIEDGRITN